MAKLGSAIIWFDVPIDAEWEDLSEEAQAVFIEMATPDDEIIELAKSTVAPELGPFLDAELSEELG